ncbi:MAG: TRAP transporter substrate-binding protein, partial [Rhodospirillaceae bacterium]|nr:TRAP transporter substrate-binding protein [Rhodospirillaceae bacterium]
MHSFVWYMGLVILFTIVLIVSVPSESAEDDYLGTVGAATFPGDIGERIWLDYEKTVLERSNGEIRLRMLIRGETGGEESRMPSLLRGRVHVSSFSDSGMSRVVPEFGLLAAPFLFNSLEEVHFVVDNYLKQPYAELAEDKGFVVLNWQDVGWLNIYGGKPLLTPVDTAGYRMRSLQSSASVLFLQAIGADVIHIQRTELVSSLQTGLVEGGESSLVLYASGGEAEYAGHMTRTRHARQFGFSVVNRRWFERLSEANRDIIATSFGPESAQRGMAVDLLRDEEARLSELGATVHELTGDKRMRFRDRALPNQRVLVDEIGGRAQEIMD